MLVKLISENCLHQHNEFSQCIAENHLFSLIRLKSRFNWVKNKNELFNYSNRVRVNLQSDVCYKRIDHHIGKRLKNLFICTQTNDA